MSVRSILAVQEAVLTARPLKTLEEILTLLTWILALGILQLQLGKKSVTTNTFISLSLVLYWLLLWFQSYKLDHKK